MLITNRLTLLSTPIFKTISNVIIFPASGTGAWEAALVNTVNEGDLVLMVETGHFATLWKKMADKLGINTEFLETDWRRGVEPEKLLDRLKKFEISFTPSCSFEYLL